jgi:DNA-binding GntR family transcriptional regulator
VPKQPVKSAKEAYPSGRLTAYQAIRSRIVNLELPPGSALSENELAAVLGMSRTPVREALILLADEGLVQVFPKLGSFVSRVDPTKMADAQFLRQAVELAALDLIADPPAKALDALRTNLEAQHDPNLTVPQFFELDEEFHAGLLALSGHGGSWPAVAAAKGHLDRARMLGLQTSPQIGNYVAEHQAIFDATQQGDIAQAKQLLRDHLRTIFEDIERIRAESPELFATDPTAVPVLKTVAVWL